MSFPEQYTDFQRPQNTIDVPPYGIALDNRRSHYVGISPNAAAFGKRFGYVPPYMRTNNYHYAKMTDGRTYKRTWSAEYPYRQVPKQVAAKLYVTSPGKNVNAPKLTGQDVLVIQALRKRGII